MPSGDPFNEFLKPIMREVGEDLARASRALPKWRRILIVGGVAALVVSIMAFAACGPSRVGSFFSVVVDLSEHTSLIDPTGSSTALVPTTAPPKQDEPTVAAPPPASTGDLTPQPNQAAEVQAFITSPANDTTVPELTRFEGIFSNLPQADCLWLLIDSPWNKFLFRQGPLWTRQDGTFDRRVTIGSGYPDDQGKSFVVNVAFVPEAVCSQWLEEDRIPGGYLSQIDQLPDGVVLISSVVVHLDRTIGEDQITPAPPGINKETGS